MPQKPEILKASIISPIIILLPVTILTLGLIIGEILEIPWLASTDDAPVRAAGLILIVIVPIAYPVLLASMTLLGNLLYYLKLLSKRNVYSICIAVSLLAGICFGWPSPYGIKDQIIGVGIFFSFTLFSLLLGTYFWWKIAMRNYKN